MPRPQAAPKQVALLTRVMRSRWLPLGVGIAPALGGVLVRRGAPSTAG